MQTTTRLLPILSFLQVLVHKMVEIIRSNYYTWFHLGEIKSVEGTIFDLRKNMNVNKLLKEFPEGPNGYDNNFCINTNERESVRLVAR